MLRLAGIKSNDTRALDFFVCLSLHDRFIRKHRAQLDSVQVHEARKKGFASHDARHESQQEKKVKNQYELEQPRLNKINSSHNMACVSLFRACAAQYKQGRDLTGQNLQNTNEKPTDGNNISSQIPAKSTMNAGRMLDKLIGAQKA